jgi:histidine triad (HIT) family protein
MVRCSPYCLAMTDRADGSSGRAEVKPCVFCEIVAGARPAQVVLSDDVVVAFLDRRPLFRGHTLVVPRRHVVTLADLESDQVGPFYRRVQAIAAAMPEALDADGTFVANNNVVSQSVAHLHVHVIPRRRGDGLRGFFWPRERYADGEDDVFASRLRRVLDRIPID